MRTKIYLLMLALLSSTFIYSQTITKGEWFVDTDPGVGLCPAAQKFTMTTPSDSVLQNIAIPTTGFTAGYHYLYFRTFQSNGSAGRWGNTERLLFYINAIPTTPTYTTASPIAKGEWFVDTDPGVGLCPAAQKFTTTSADSITQNISIPTTGYTAGYHYLYARVKSSDNKWGATERVPFYVNTVPSTPTYTNASPLKRGEYFVDNDPGVGSATSFAISGTPDSATVTIPSAATGGLGNGLHYFYYRVKSTDNKWGNTESIGFYVCNTNVPNTVISYIGQPIVCTGGTKQFSVPLQSGFSYQWLYNGSSIANETYNTYNAPYNYPGNYSVVVTNPSGCSAISQSVNLTVDPSTAVAPTITTNTAQTTICGNSNVTFTTSFTNGGSTPSFVWKKNGIIINGQTNTSLTLNNLTTGDSISCVMSSSAFCATTSTVESNKIGMTILPAISASAGSDVSICVGASTTLAASGGTTYSWAPSNTLSDATIPNPIATPTNTTNYIVAVSNGTGCVVYDTVLVSIIPPPTATITPQGVTTFCSGGSVALLANTGTGFTYQWQKNGTNITANAAGYNANSSGSYTVIVTDANGCSNTSATQLVTVNPSVVPIVVLNASQTTICSGDFVTFNATPINGGTNPTYVWKKNNAVISGQTTASYTTSSIVNGDQFTVLMTSNANCASPTTATAPLVTITVSSAVPALVSITPNDTTLCAGQNLLMLANNIQGGGAAPTYQWYKNGVIIAGANTASYTTTTSANNDYYTVEMTSNSSCAIGSPAMSSAQFVAVQNNVTPTISIVNNTGTACAGAPIDLVANVTNAGSAPYILWRVNGFNFAGTTTPNFSVSNLHNNDLVTALLFSSEECISTSFVSSNALTASITTVNYGLAFSANNTTLTSVPFFAQFNNSSIGASNVTYRWFFGDGTSTVAQSPNHFYSSNGIYTVTLFARDTVSGCVDTLRKSNYINCSGGVGNYNCAQTASVSPSTTIQGCIGGSAKLTATTNATAPTYQWNINGVTIGGESQSTITTSINGYYSVTIFEGGGCPVTSPAVQVTFNSAPPSAPTISQSGSINACSGGSLTLTANGSFSNYQWSNGATTQSITVSTSGVYTVEGSNNAGCNVLSNPKIINASYLPAPDVCMVSVDTVSGFARNLIVWEKLAGLAIDSFIILKESSVYGVFNKIAAKGYNQLSEYLDVTSNPGIHPDRYRIIAKDTCGGYSLPGAIHRTMHLQISPGIGTERNLSWNNQEGQNVSTYEVWSRKIGTNATPWALVDSVSAAITTWTDPNPLGDTMRYRVDIVLQSPCNSTKSNLAQRIKASSNTTGNNKVLQNDFTTSINKVVERNWFTIYPNPAKDVLTVSFCSNCAESDKFNVLSTKLSITDMLGKEVLNETIKNQHSIVNIQQLSKGVYFVRIDNTVKKLVVE